MRGQRFDAHNAHVDHGDITVYGGVASAYVAAWADAFGAPPEAVVRATAIVPPLVDTSVPKARESHERPIYSGATVPGLGYGSAPGGEIGCGYG